MRSLLTLLLACWLPEAACQDWQATGPEGGQVAEVNIPDPLGSRVYALGGNGMVYRSDDRGDTWRHLPIVVDDRLFWTADIATSGADPDVIVALHSSGVMRSADAGASWTALAAHDDMHGAAWLAGYTAVAVDPHDARHIMVFRNVVLQGALDAWVWRSGDAGASGEHRVVPRTCGPFDPPRRGFQDRVYAAAFLGGEPRFLHFHGCQANPQPNPWLRHLEHEGATALPGPSTHATAGDLALHAGKVLVRSHRRIVRVDGYGDLHTPNAYRVLREGAFALAALPDGSLVSSESTGLHRSTDGGQSWQALAGSAGLPGGVIAAFSQPARWLAASIEGIQASADGGIGWTSASRGLHGTVVSALLLDPEHGRRLWAGTGLAAGKEFSRAHPVPVHRSEDGGMQWSAAAGAPHAMLVGSLTLAPTSQGGGVLVAAGSGCPESFGQTCTWTSHFGQNLMRSTDGGRQWQATGAGLDQTVQIAGLAASTQAGAPAVLIASLDGTFSEDRVVARSVDGGQSWTGATIDGLLPRTGQARTRGLAVAPSLQTRVYMAYTGVERGGVLRSDDAGRTWQDASTGIPSAPQGSLRGAYAVAVHPHDPDSVWAIALLAGTEGEPARNAVFASRDGGSTWQPSGALPTGPWLRVLRVDPADPRRLYAGGDGGVFRSIDGGDGWHRLGRILPAVYALEVGSDAIHAGTATGVHRYATAAPSRPAPCLRRTPRGQWCGEALAP
ncbi:MAG: hypothetical protein KF823_02935 [Xanthomonadales bacterium]|nr:hypothetical protein [Xanthomonadales bacterium]